MAGIAAGVSSGSPRNWHLHGMEPDEVSLDSQLFTMPLSTTSSSSNITQISAGE